MSEKCPESVPDTGDIAGTLSGHFSDTLECGAGWPRGHPPDTPSDTPIFGDTPSDTPGHTRPRRARETPVRGRRCLNESLGLQAPWLPKGPSRTKNTTDSKFTIRSKFATAIVEHDGGHFETTVFKRKL